MNFIAPASEQVSVTGSRARSWLLELYQLITVDSSIPLASVLQTLIGCWICEKALVKNVQQSGAHMLAQEALKRLDLGEQEIFSVLLSSDAALILLFAGILRSFNIKNTAVEQFLQQVASATQGHNDQTEATELFATRFLLHNLGLQQMPDICAIGSFRTVPETNLIQAEEAIIRSLLISIAAATAYGQSHPSMVEPRALEDMIIALPIWMLYYLRQHNLEIGASLLRAMSYLHLQEDRAFQMGLNFILAQQQLDGRFGFLGPEISQLQSANAHFDEIFQLYLPLTISCLWTIAEATAPGFTLFSSI